MYENKAHTRQQGFVALMTVILVSAILLVMLFTLEISGFFARFDSLATENKRQSLSLAEACINAAMLKVALNASYAPAAGGECVSLGGTCGGTDPQKVCKICSVTYSGGNATVDARAVYFGSFSNVRARFSTTVGAMTINRWEELPTLAGTCTVP